MPKRAIVVAVVVLGALSGCSSAKSPTEVSTCMVGWWQGSPANACNCSNSPECSAGDCERLRVRRFAADGKMTEGYIVSSASLGSTSTVGVLSNGTYSLPDDAHVILNGVGDPLDVKCTSERLTIRAFVDARTSEKLAASLTAAVQAHGTSWTAAPSQQ